MKNNETKFSWRTIAVVPMLLALVAATALIRPSSFAAGPKLKIDTPVLTFAGNSPASIDITVTAPLGGTGLPAGFSIQWMTQADYDAFGGWPIDETSAPASFCKASFSGNANASRYNLDAGDSVTVRIGDITLDNGASTTCDTALACGTDYIFRAFGHATSSRLRSDWSANLQASTLDCSPPPGCTYTQGYWKTHGPIPTGHNTNVWPVSSLTLGTRSYTQLELQSIFNQSPGGNGLVTLAHQLIAAKLNVANGANPTSIAAAIASADALIANAPNANLVVPPVGSGSLSPGVVSGLVNTLNYYNNGGPNGVGHCSDEILP